MIDDPLAGYRDQLADAINREPSSRRRLALLVAVPVVLAAVMGVRWAADDNESAPVAVESADAEASTDLDDLVGVDWHFTFMTFNDDRPRIGLSDEVTELRFEEDGTYTAQVCNYHGGTYEPTASGSITMEPGPSTQIACGGTIGDAEHALHTYLDGQVRWEVQGDTLTLSAPGIAVSLRATQPVFPKRLTILERADHPASAQYAIGYSGDPDGTQSLEILTRPDPSQEFTSASVDSGLVLAPAGLTAPEHGTIVASWLPPNTSKAWVQLSTGGAEINLRLEPLSNGRLVGWASLPEPSGEIVAFDTDGNEIDRSAPFDF